MKDKNNIGKNKFKSQKGAISLLVALTIFTFMAILTGTFLTISVLRRSQTESNAKIKKIYEADVDNVDNVYKKIITNIKNADGKWDSQKKINTPKLTGTGLIPVYWEDNGTLVELNALSSEEEFENWYNYDERKWANAITKDDKGNITGYFVWIPRFAYRIKDNLGNGGDLNGEIDVIFVDINNQNGGAIYKDTYPTVTNDSMDNYVVHPAFVGNVNNGGWDDDIEGFWIAKYPAGFQANTISKDSFSEGEISLINSTDTVVYSNKKYTADSSNVFGDITKNTSKISYPVFKPLTYTYNRITIGDMYTISREVGNATNFYRLEKIDSHLEKNSEWGAVAYLTQSKYGRNKQEVNINNYNTSENDTCRIAITGVYADGTSNGATQSINAVNAYDSQIGKNGSSTGNIYGVYDLNGCVWERTAGYIANGNEDLYGESITENTTSNRYVTVYPYDNNTTQSSQTNYQEYKNSLRSNYGFGDAIVETSNSGSTNENSWYRDYSNFATNEYLFLTRGGRFDSSLNAGIFAFQFTTGNPAYGGFRVVLVAE